jgi:hypothetical protein
MFADHQVRTFRQYLAATPEAQRSTAGYTAFVRGRRPVLGAYDSMPPDGPVLTTVAGGKSTMRFGRDDKAETEPHGGGVREIKERGATVTEFDQETEKGAGWRALEAAMTTLSHEDRQRVHDAVGSIVAGLSREHDDEIKRGEKEDEIYRFLRSKGLDDASCRKALKMGSDSATRLRIDEHLATDALVRGATKSADTYFDRLNRQSKDNIFADIVGVPRGSIRTYSQKSQRSFAERFPDIPLRRIV